MAMRAVDLDLFVNSASKGFNDGAKVPTPFAAFTDALSKGIDQYYENEQKAQQTEASRVATERAEQIAPYEAAIKEAEAAKAKLTMEAIEENPEAYKETIVTKAKADKAEADRQLAITLQKNKMNDLLNSKDGQVQGDAYITGELSDLFNANPQAKKQYVDSTFSNWGKNAQDVYLAEQKQQRQAATNDVLLDESTKTFEKLRPDYVANRDINILKQMIQESTGEPVSDSDLFENGSLFPIVGRKQIPKRIQATDANGNPVFEGDGKVPKMIDAPPGKFGPEYIDDPTALKGDTEQRNVFSYKGKQYQVGAGISTDTSTLFNAMQSSYRRINYLDKGQGGDLDLETQVKQKEKAQNDVIATAQAEANTASTDIQKQRELFVAGADVATQQLAKDKGIIPSVTPSATVTPAPTSSVQAPTSESVVTPVAKVPQTIPTATATPTATPAPSNSNIPVTPEQQNIVIKKQAQAAKGNQFLSKYQQPSDKKVTPPISPTAQAAVTSKSVYIPSNLTTDIEYKPDQEAISRVASRPEMQGLSALTKAVAVHESRGVNDATSPTGVIGIMQVTGPTGKSINPDFDRTNPIQQATAGAITLAKLEQKYPNNPMLVLTAYNAGEAVVNEAIRLAGTTNWIPVRDKLEEAVNSERIQNLLIKTYENAGISKANARKFAKGKAKEVRNYAEKVIVNLPAFAFNSDDDRTIRLLQQQGVFNV